MGKMFVCFTLIVKVSQDSTGFASRALTEYSEKVVSIYQLP